MVVDYSLEWWHGYVEKLEDGTDVNEEKPTPMWFPPNFTNDTGGWTRPAPRPLGEKPPDQGACSCCASGVKRESKRQLQTGPAV